MKYDMLMLVVVFLILPKIVPMPPCQYVSRMTILGFANILDFHVAFIIRKIIAMVK
jgi:hypothetical protein